jgi:hypothetical protein
MNDNLRELVFKAYTLCEKKTYGWIRNEEEFRQRFAEVIIRECMTICKKHPSRDLENLWSADAVAPDLVHQFSEHFGVEE